MQLSKLNLNQLKRSTLGRERDRLIYQTVINDESDSNLGRFWAFMRNTSSSLLDLEIFQSKPLYFSF